MTGVSLHWERRTARPFDLPPSIGDLLKGTSLRFGENTIEARGSLQWDDPTTFASQPVAITWHDEETFDDFKTELAGVAGYLDLDLRDLALVITATSRYLGMSNIVEIIPLDAFGVHRNTVDLRRSRPHAAGLSSGVRGGRIDTYLLLMTAQTPTALRPWRKGTWLARTHFTIATDHDERLFRPVALTGALRDEKALSSGVMRHVEISGSVWEPYDPDVPPTVYLDAAILADIAARPREPVSRLLQAELACTFIRSVLAVAYAERTEWKHLGWSGLRDSLLGRVVRAIVGQQTEAVYEAHLQRLAEDGIERLASESESAIELMGSVREGLRGGR